MGEDNRDRLRRVWCGVYADVRHELARLVRRLEAFKSDVLSTLELNEVLDAAKASDVFSVQEKEIDNLCLLTDRSQTTFRPYSTVRHRQCATNHL